jgi:hypothetical protein
MMAERVIRKREEDVGLGFPSAPPDLMASVRSHTSVGVISSNRSRFAMPIAFILRGDAWRVSSNAFDHTRRARVAQVLKSKRVWGQPLVWLGMPPRKGQ